MERSEVGDKKASIMRNLAEKMGFSSGGCSSQQTSAKGTTSKSKGTKNNQLSLK